MYLWVLVCNKVVAKGVTGTFWYWCGWDETIKFDWTVIEVDRYVLQHESMFVSFKRRWQFLMRSRYREQKWVCAILYYMNLNYQD